MKSNENDYKYFHNRLIGFFKNLYSSLLLCYQNEQIGLIEHIKAYIESVCLTIFSDYGVEIEKSSPTTSDLLSQLWRILGFENTKGVSKIDKLISGYNKISDAIIEMRNETGIVSHGKDGFFEVMQKEHMRSFLLAGDSILCLIFSALDGKEPDIKYTREPYERFIRFNTIIDDSVLCRANTDEDEKIIILDFYHEQNSSEIQLRVEPSRLLFNLDRDAYIELMEVSTPQKIDELLEKTPENFLVEEATVAFEEKPKNYEFEELRQIGKYEGIYLDYYLEFKRYLNSVIPEIKKNELDKLTSAILNHLEIYQYPEWKSREVLKAKIMTAIKRFLLFFGIFCEEYDIPEKIFYWLKTNIQLLD